MSAREETGQGRGRAETGREKDSGPGERGKGGQRQGRTGESAERDKTEKEERQGQIEKTH